MPDWVIAYWATVGDMIAPFHPEQIRKIEDIKIISKGLSGFGYDVSLKAECKVFTNVNSAHIDPKNFDEQCLVDIDFKVDKDGVSKYVLLPPNSYLLGVTNETFKIPEDVLVVVLGKSTYARCGAIVNVTPIEPGFEGQVVIEIANTTTLPMKIYADEGIAQFVFFRSQWPCQAPYDKGRKYQGQSGIVLPRV